MCARFDVRRNVRKSQVVCLGQLSEGTSRSCITACFLRRFPVPQALWSLPTNLALGQCEGAVMYALYTTELFCMFSVLVSHFPPFALVGGAFLSHWFALFFLGSRLSELLLLPVWV